MTGKSIGNFYREHIEHWLNKLVYFYQQHIEPCLKGLWFLRIPVVVAVLSIISFGFVPQTIEVYRVLALNAAEPKPSFADLQAVFSFVFILVLSFSIWYSANILIKYESDYKLYEQEQEQKRKLKQLSNILSFLPIGSLIFGLSKATTNFWDNLNGWTICIGSICFISLLILYCILIVKYSFSKFENPNKFKIILCASISFTTFCFFTFILIIPEISINISSITIQPKPILIAVICLLILFEILLFLIPGLIEMARKGKPIVLILIAVLITGFIIFCHYTNKPELVISVLNPLSIVAISFSGFVIFGSLISYMGYKYKFPILAILLILLTCFSCADLNDNHRIRQVENHQYQEPSTLKDSFSKWRTDREYDIKQFRDAGKRYPIYIVSAQGGGIFAAYHAASTLSRLQDLCPEFASHVFAISGVSGGSLGAAVFSSLINTEFPSLIKPKLGSCVPYPPGKLEEKAQKLLDHDFLSPLLAAGLFPDSIQGFLPFPINILDRARGLEYAFEKAWNSAYEDKPNLLKGAYYDHWKPGNAAPALVLNTTVVETGDRLVLSPFKIDLPNLKDISMVACKQEDMDFPLSTAAVLSARFTFVTPVGWFNRCDRCEKGEIIQSSSQKSRLADGGYFENSGVSTAVEIGSRLEEFLREEEETDIAKMFEKKFNANEQEKKLITEQKNEELQKAEGKTNKEEIMKRFEEKLKINKKNKESIDYEKYKKRQKYKETTNKVVYLAITDLRPQKITKDGKINEAGGLNEIMSPINALYNSRDARGFSIVDQAEYLTDPASADPKFKSGNLFKKHYSDQRFRQLYLHNPKLECNKDGSICNGKKIEKGKPLSSTFKPDKQEFPLGWFLSKPSQEEIKNLVGSPQSCGDNLQNTSNNDCVFQSIKDELNIEPT